MIDARTRTADALRTIGVTDADIEVGHEIAFSFPSPPHASLRQLCDLTERLAVSMTGAGFRVRTIRVTGAEARMTMTDACP